MDAARNGTWPLSSLSGGRDLFGWKWRRNLPPANEALLAASSTAVPTVTAAYRRTHADTFMTGSLFLFVRVETSFMVPQELT